MIRPSMFPLYVVCALGIAIGTGWNLHIGHVPIWFAALMWSFLILNGWRMRRRIARAKQSDRSAATATTTTNTDAD